MAFLIFFREFFKVRDKILYDPLTALTPEYPKNYRARILHNPTKYGLNRLRGPRVREHFHLLGTFCHAPVSMQTEPYNVTVNYYSMLFLPIEYLIH
jgi:hypothetical protein